MLDSSPLHQTSVATGWLDAIPIAPCGIHLDDEAIRVAVGLMLGCLLFESRTCRCGGCQSRCPRNVHMHTRACKTLVEFFSITTLNDVIWRSFTRAGVSSMKESHGLLRDNGKRPNGLTLLPWQSGRCATWDETVVDSLGTAYLQHNAIAGASAAEIAGGNKVSKYSRISVFFQLQWKLLAQCAVASTFCPILAERSHGSDPRELAFLFQRLKHSDWT